LSTQVSNIKKTQAGLCPHGLPPSACPICSKMGGGSSLRAGERVQKPGEMSYHECAMIGNMLRAQKLAKKIHAQNLEQRELNLKIFEKNLELFTNKLSEFINKYSNNIFFKPTVLIISNIILPTVNFIKNIPNLIINFSNKLTLIKDNFINIIDKLTAIWGEAKAFIDKKVSEFINLVKTKFKSLFKIFKRKNVEDDDTKIDDDKKIYNLKTILNKIFRKKKDKNDDDSKN